MVTWRHYCDVTMGTIASQITSLTIVYTTVYSDADQSKHQSSASLAFVRRIHRDRWIPRTKGQLRGKCFHLMTSSWMLSASPALCGESTWAVDSLHKGPVMQRFDNFVVDCANKPTDYFVHIRSSHFLSLNLQRFHKNIRSWVENECCCPCATNISNANFTSKIWLCETPSHS